LSIDDNNRSLTYGTSRLAPAIRLVDRAKEIELAHESIQSHTNAKLELILKQIRHLQMEAQGIIENAALDAELHSIPCNFEKKVDQPYHLYLRPEGKKYFSFLSPTDWGGNPPHEFLGSFVMKSDRSFQKLD
jgi:hypothetical protein